MYICTFYYSSSYVSFGEKQRYLGISAKNQVVLQLNVLLTHHYYSMHLYFVCLPYVVFHFRLCIRCINCYYYLSKERTNVKNTVSQFKRFIGKQFSDPDIQHELQTRMIPYDVLEIQDGKIGIKVGWNFRNESKNEMSF